MNEDLNMDDFEHWLKGQADKHSMYPSDRLWRNISQEIHEHSRWPALTFSAVLTGALFMATLIFSHPNKDFTLLTKTAGPVITSPIVDQSELTASRSANSQPVIQKARTLKPLPEEETLYSFNHTITPASRDINRFYTAIPDTLVNAMATADTDPSTTPLLAAADLPPGNNTNIAKLASSFTTVGSSANNGLSNQDIVPASDVSSGLAADQEQSTAKNLAADAGLQSGTTSAASVRLPASKKTHWHIEFYSGSNISYRRLSEPYAYNSHAGGFNSPTPADQTNVNQVVKQKPAIGFNIGSAFTYAVSNKLKIKAGLQFNYRQYNIDAFKSQYERAVLLLNNGYFSPDSVYMYSVISNEKGRAITLNNRYYQIGVPVTLEWAVVQSPKFSVNLAASVQPTYQVNGNVYLLTSDYKSYVQAPELLRRINVNAGAEATVAFDAGGIKWQVGPQVLYQTLPTQKGNYSIREHLFDYGLRVGIIKQLH